MKFRAFDISNIPISNLPIYNSKFRNKMKSAVHSSIRKLKIIEDVHELRRKKFWSGTRSHVIKEIWRIFEYFYLMVKSGKSFVKIGSYK